MPLAGSKLEIDADIDEGLETDQQRQPATASRVKSS
jgi:hypothetical protein